MTITRSRTREVNSPWYTSQVCEICESPAVRFFYPAPMCATCHNDWSE